MNPSRKPAMAFKKLFHPSKPTLFLALCKDDSGKNKPSNIHGTLKNQWKALEKLNRAHHNIFMLINTVSGKTRTSDQVTKANAFFIDYDRADWTTDNIEAFLDKFSVRPHFVAETSPGRFHVYWLVKDVPLDRFALVQQKLAAKFNSDPAVCDLSRMMRMPGTINWKHADPFLVRTVFADEDAEPISYESYIKVMFEADDFPTLCNDVESTKNTAIRNSDDGDLAERVNKALQSIPADDRKIWFTVGVALQSTFGDSGLEMFKRWSSTSPKYEAQELERQWRSFKREGGIKIATVFWLAKNQIKKLDSAEVGMPEQANLLALADHFAQASKDCIRHCEADNKWYVYSNGRWVQSNKLAERVAINYLRNMNSALLKSAREEMRGLLERSQSLASARELLRAAESDPTLSVTSNAFDQAPNVLGFRLPDIPGTVERYVAIYLDRTKGNLAEPNDMIHRIAGAPFDREATCPRWLEFIDQITVGDSNLAEFLQIAVGYTLYGHAKEQVMFVLIGSGGNGKGVFSRILFKLLGDYSALMQSNLLKPGAINGNAPSPALMKLRSKRLWVCSEMPRGMVLDEALTKQITGGDLVSSRGLYRDQVEFQPIGKLWLSVNDMPRIRHDDKGMWRRIIPIPFNAVFTGKNRDNDLEEKLQGELSGILNWALEGARKYAKRGTLERPLASKKLLTSLRRDVDTVGQWIHTRCVRANDGKLQSKPAYEDYCETMKRERTSPVPQKEFKADLIRRGFEHKSGRSYNYFVGIVLSTT